jgi:uncharacterized repeat protein (TIGR03803 family)
LSGLVEGADGRLYGAGVNCLYVVNANGTTSVLQQMSLSQGGGLQGTLIQGADGALYGTAIAGGAFAADNPSAPCNTFSGCGSVFRYDILADQFSVLFSFDGGLNGNAPIGGLFQASDGLLYGTTSLGGQNGHGTVFSISTSGGLETFHHFDNAGGSEPRATLSEGSDGQLYSTTYDGGVNPAFGVVYRVTLPPPPDTTPPVVTPPAALTVDAVSLSGISGDQSPALRGFLAGGSATDDIDPAPVRLTPQVGGVDATSATVFPVGTSTVTFRYHDGGGNVGTATSDVTVISPQRRIVGSGANAPEPKLSASFSVDVTGPFAPSGSLEYVTTTTSPNGAPRVKVQLVSTSLTSVTVNGGTMTIEGTGTIGKGVYTFTATITDGAADQLGIVIRRQNGNVYYSASAAPLTSGGVTLTIPD